MRQASFSLLLLLLALPLTAQEKWPTRFQSPKPALEQLPDKDGATIWTTRHFIIVSEVQISQPHLLNLTQTMESIPLLFKQLSIPLWAPPKTEKAVIRFCKNETSFVARGAPVDAAGSYNPRSAEILIRGDLLLNPPKALPSQLNLGPNEDLIVHELTHLAMHQYGGVLPAWLTEGLAEYFAACHTGKGSYDFSQSHRLIRQHIAKFYPIERYPTLTLPAPNSLVGISPRQWIDLNRITAPENRYQPYATALLLAHYHLEGGIKRRSELATHLKKILQTRQHREVKPLLQNPNTISKQLTAFWKPKGLTLRFQASEAKEFRP